MQAAETTLIDNRNSAITQRQHAASLLQSPASSHQREIVSKVNASPLVVTQRQRLAESFGEAAPLRENLEDEELFQGRFKAIQRQSVEEEEPLQGKFSEGTRSTQLQSETVKSDNRTGMPDQLKAGIESLSGMDISDVRVHRNSPKPTQLNALAFAQGKEIHLGSGQERNLPHEAWHVVQQRQGRVKPTMQTKGVPINDDSALEQEADVMVQKALQGKFGATPINATRPLVKKYSNSSFVQQNTIQRITFERSTLGKIGGIFGRADADADRWIATFNLLNTLATVTLTAQAANLAHFPEFNQGYTLPRAFVLANAAAHIAAANRVAVGAQILFHYQHAHELENTRLPQVVTLGGPKCVILGGFNANQWDIFDSITQLPATLANLAGLTNLQFTDFFNLPIAALNDFITIPNAQKAAILANIPVMLGVSDLDQAYNAWNGAAKQGHTFSEHGAHHSDVHMQGLADGSGNPKGRWLTFAVQQAAITQAENHMWNLANYPGVDSALRTPGNNWIHPGGIYNNARHLATRANPNPPRTKKKVDLINQNFGGGNTGTTFFPMPGVRFWGFWQPGRPAPVVAGNFTAIFQLQQGGGAYRVLTAYPVV
ncbi:MAG: DUF4157 domain-containing protein [Gammaproteobacteria bacterium]|nr:DUF4157 domain-containing protein [Gammaproteobacteria bacterium]